jgi:putative PIN family toxin of toxin-antitoxin system
MNVVIDTNVLISGLLNPRGLPGQILNLVLSEKITMLFDNRILEEYYNVLNRDKFKLSKQLIDPLMDFIKNAGVYIVPEPIKIKFEDEEDKKFLEVALSGVAKYLITGNKKHFPEKDFIVNPKEYFENIED